MARRSYAVQAVARLNRPPDADTARRRALDDARGQLVREGVTYLGAGEVRPWRIVRSVRGRTDQLDVIVGGTLWRTGGPRRVARWLRK